MEQVIFKIDKKLKAKAMKKAKAEGISYSLVLREATEAFVEDKLGVGITYSPKLIRDVRQSQKEVREGKILRGDIRELLKKV